ncbi:outer membrane lipoprotein-sorting protein [Pseudobacteriovorax antillogorgiicola]|uniref:Outer membrane lipoprotein-sorting protein n=1 Tax=Pseudobacteriovorax antillogorgiicola TaxID=1513793 RepID=A0A1Y6BU18_9BACT|nr:outer membrane lipoprotein-sorting protein [Pseudobacteriovorax antillogorgiicola]TCS54568.1 outer membrane lipoprotein-sorting protein [Pseudobacteriovorax antillogorgiicola]SMF18188.1 Outer membrane lipoprotein-sorting protein [Pseudobacteriovorax antillogorgiicola]
MKKLIIMAAILATGQSNGMDAESILKKADEIRNPSNTYRMEVTVESTDGSHNRFEIAIGGKDKSLIKTLEPRRDVGKNFLMLEENMWAYVPNINRSLQVSLNQKISGQASNGDISRMRWHGDYDVTLEGEDKDHWQLLLVAKRNGLTYDKIRAWIKKKNFRPAKADYMTKTGRKIKHIEFVKFKKLAGGLRPSKMVITDATDSSKSSILRIRKMKKTAIPGSYFVTENLK